MTRARGWRVAALAGVSLLLLSSECADPNAPKATLRFEPQSITVPANTFFTLTVVVESDDEPVRAWELQAATDPAVAGPIGAQPHPEFDDDGAFFLAPDADPAAGTLVRAVDVRHGGAGALGEFRIATLLLVSGDAGMASLSLAGSTLVGDTGQTFAVTGGHTSILVTP